MMKKLLLLSFCALIAVSCSLTGSINLESSDFDGGAVFDVSNTEYFEDLLSDFSAWTDTDYMTSVTSYLEKLEPVYNIGCVSEGNSSTVSFDFDSLYGFASSVPCLDVERKGERTTVKVLIDSETFDSLQGVLPFSEGSVFALYSPRYNESMEEDEYLEMLEFIFEEGISEQIRNSSVTFEINLPSPVISTNAQVISEKCVSYTVPLIKLLLLKNPISFEVEF